MGSELERALKVYSTATASLIYSYYVLPRIPKHLTILRFIAVVPVIILFTLLPFSLHSFQLRGLTAFVLIWLANFKLLLLAFDVPGPLSQPISLVRFLTSALFPVNVRITKTSSSSPRQSLNILKSMLLFLIKVILFLSILVYLSRFEYKKTLHPYLVLVLYCFFLYFATEIIFAIAVLPVKVFLGKQYELDPQFNEPYLSNSLQDFWGRRWNLMVPTILRPSVYLPLRGALAPITGYTPASFVATFASFAVSGLMHELFWFMFTNVRPTWEVTCFFMLNGVCTGAEVAVKRAVGGRLTLPAVVSTPLTLGFLALTANWLFFPQLLRNRIDELAISEYAPIVQLLVTQKL